MDEWMCLSSWPLSSQECEPVMRCWLEPMGKVSFVSVTLTQSIKDRWLIPASSHGHLLSTCVTTIPFFIVLLASFPLSKSQIMTHSQVKLPPLGSHLLTKGDPHLAPKAPRLFSLKNSISWHPIFSSHPSNLRYHFKHTGLISENHKDRTKNEPWNC